MTIKKKIKYKDCEIDYTVSTDATNKNQFSAFCFVTCFVNGSIIPKELIRDRLCDSSAQAEEEIVNKAKRWIDENIR